MKAITHRELTSMLLLLGPDESEWRGGDQTVWSL